MSSRAESTGSSAMPDSVDEYLDRLAVALAGLPGPDRREIVAETRSHIEERYAEVGEPARVSAVVEELGPPETYAEEFLENYPEAGGAERVPWAPRAWRWAGSIVAAIAFSISFVLVLWAVFLLLVAADPPPWLIWAELTFGGVHVLAILTLVVGVVVAVLGVGLRRRGRRR